MIWCLIIGIENGSSEFGNMKYLAFIKMTSLEFKIELESVMCVEPETRSSAARNMSANHALAKEARSSGLNALSLRP